MPFSAMWVAVVLLKKQGDNIESTTLILTSG
jgi:hypothetical protein